MTTHRPDSQINDRLEDALTNHPALETLAETLQVKVGALLEHVPEPVVAFLHGQTIGHPLHPLLVHLPIGGWLIAGILDALPVDEAERGADLAMLLGTVGAVGTIASGVVDWATTRGHARRTGMVHALLNDTAFLLYSASLVSRWGGHRKLGKGLSGGGLAISLVAAFLGGQLVYRHGLGVRRTLATPQG
jgi:uncharacterized membrane protein